MHQNENGFLISHGTQLIRGHGCYLVQILKGLYYLFKNQFLFWHPKCNFCTGKLGILAIKL